MEFYDVVGQVLALLQCQGRVSYRVLKRPCDPSLAHVAAVRGQDGANRRSQHDCKVYRSLPTGCLGVMLRRAGAKITFGILIHQVRFLTRR